jgi:epoxyqueuosine reductase
LSSRAIVLMMSGQQSAVNFIEDAIESYVRESPGNRLPSFNNEPIFDGPLTGFADADDPIFQEYKEIIGEYHMTPREAFSAGLKDRGIGQEEVKKLSVISWSLPISLATRLSLRRESQVPSLRWNHTRFQGQDFINDLSRHLVSQIEKRGFHAIAPELEKSFTLKKERVGYASSWSQRHIAFAAGLGTFSLNDGFITPVGIAMRLGSVVTDMDLPVTPRTSAGIYSNCLFHRNG